MAQHPTAPPRPAVAVALGTVLACVVLLALLPAQAASNVSDVVQGVAALAAGVGAAWHVRGCTDRRTRAAWVLIAGACTAWAMGEAYWCFYTLRADVVPFPSWADVGFLGFAVLMAAGLLLYPARGGRIAFLQRLVDGLLAAGAVGLVSVVSLLVGSRLAELVTAVESGDLVKARAVNESLLPVYTGVFRTQGTIMIKAALRELGLPSGPVRPPLVDATPEQLEQLRMDLAAGGVTL